MPFEAVNGFFDPSVQFGLQFEEVVEGEDRRRRPMSKTAQDKPAKKQAAAPPSAPPPSASGGRGNARRRPRTDKPGQAGQRRRGGFARSLPQEE